MFGSTLDFLRIPPRAITRIIDFAVLFVAFWLAVVLRFDGEIETIAQVLYPQLINRQMAVFFFRCLPAEKTVAATGKILSGYFQPTLVQ